MAITRRETHLGPRFDVEWRLPDRSKRRKSFKTEREARVFEAAVVTKTASGDIVDPRAGRITLARVYESWLSSRLDISPKVRRGYQDIWRLRLEPRFGGWSVGKIDHPSIQKWVNEMAEAGLSPRTLRWYHSVLKMCLDHAGDNGQLLGRNPACRTKFPAMRQTGHTYLSTAEIAALTLACGSQGDVVSLLAYTGLRFGELTGLKVEDVDLKARRIRVRRSITQVGGKLIEGNPKSAAGRRSIPIPQRVMPILNTRLAGRPPGEPAIASPMGSLLGLENWKRSVRWRQSIIEIGRPTLRVHDLRHTYASLARRAGADLRLLQKTMGHASITVTAHTYADLYDDELDDVASALDALDDRRIDRF
ncbi:tyrosine-type recombinase/integrase [Mycolicibacterium arseniciresistens]|uniref:Tyrosine-type recombinase/integrase n=1 Tax=Mycolicibacterium arseniciresistens TaxID=3062257 RepID=A0ABT8UD19_9MYCO|nr:site-specific integrase [Mycolicibacterium arseniciresistens]MDO3634695.1 tyrosine-type recombinase/integrase [Mycolicibacterium arseniciresistens]